jgi:hypothetical protein
MIKAHINGPPVLIITRVVPAPVLRRRGKMSGTGSRWAKEAQYRQIRLYPATRFEKMALFAIIEWNQYV